MYEIPGVTSDHQATVSARFALRNPQLADAASAFLRFSWHQVVIET
jgi:hypothetical protein